MTNTMSPFVKWAGGKTQLIERLREKAPPFFHTYYEPFLGGGALFLHEGYPQAVVSDVNRELINVYRQIRDDVEAVIEAVKRLDGEECDQAYYTSVRTAYNDKLRRGGLDVECAAMMIWLNKHCFNGLYRVNGKGLFNVSWNRRTRGDSIDERNLRAVSSYLRSAKVEIRQGDFEEACADAKAGDFVFFDSPYVPISVTAAFSDYTKDGFTLADHERLAALFRRLDRLGVYLLLTNNDVPLVRELYDGYVIEPVDVRRYINCKASKRRSREVIVTNRRRPL